MHQFRKKYIVLRFLFDQKCVKESKKVLNWQNVDRCKKSSILRPLVYIDEQKRASFQNLTQAIYLIQPQNKSQQLLSLSSCRQGYHVNVSFFILFLICLCLPMHLQHDGYTTAVHTSHLPTYIRVVPEYSKEPHDLLGYMSQLSTLFS